MSDPSGGLAPLRHRNFRWFFVASTVNMIGTTMSGVALAFAVLSISDSPRALGYVLAASSIPTVLFLLYGGVLADRMPLTLVLRLGTLLTGLTQAAAAVLVITGTAQIWMLVCLEALNGTVVALTFPAFMSIMPRLVPREMLQQANVLQSMSRGALRVIGPTLSAWIVVGAGPGWALGVDAMTWLAASGILVLVHLPPRPAREDAASTLEDLREGWHFFRSTTWLWLVVLAFGCLNAIVAGAWFTLGPGQAKATIGEQGWGLVLSAESIGLLAMTFVMLRRRLRRPLWSGMIGISLLGVPLFVLGWQPHLPLLVVVAFAAGAGTELFTLGWTLAMQEHVPEEMLSRAFSYDALGSNVAAPVGELAFGPLGVAFGSAGVLMVSGASFVVICLLVLLAPSVRDLRRVPVTTAG